MMEPSQQDSPAPAGNSNVEKVKWVFEKSKTAHGRQAMVTENENDIDWLSSELAYTLLAQQYDPVGATSSTLWTTAQHLICIFRCLRNACISSAENAQAILTTGTTTAAGSGAGIIQQTAELVKSKVYDLLAIDLDNGISADETTTEQEDLQLCLAIIQFLSNYMANGSEYASDVWSAGQTPSSSSSPCRFGVGDIFRDLMALSVRYHSRKALSASIGAIYISIRGEDTIGRAILSHFCTCRALICQMILGLMPDFKVDRPGSDDAAVMEWAHVWMVHLLRTGMLSAVFDLIGPTLQSGDTADPALDEVKSVLTHEQLIYLALGEDVFGDPTLTAHVTLDSETTLAMLQALVATVASRLEALETTAHRMFTKETLSGSDCASSDPVITGLNEDAVPTCLSFLSSVILLVDASLSSPLSSSSSSLSTPSSALLIRETVVKHGIISFCSKLLGARQQIRTANVQTDVGGRRTIGVTESDSVKQTTKAILQLLGNVVYRCTLAQDALRESSAFAAVLSNCGTDFQNPLAREWALLCVRNACEGNVANQQFVDSLRPQQAIVDPALQESGIRVDVDAETGKFKFNQSSS